uniref:Uncharacterized protein n=1 Tax=Arion vulgaris TaxID=1028688 RepID=A0A0B6ZIU1_9EUPU
MMTVSVTSEFLFVIIESTEHILHACWFYREDGKMRADWVVLLSNMDSIDNLKQIVEFIAAKFIVLILWLIEKQKGEFCQVHSTAWYTINVRV